MNRRLPWRWWRLSPVQAYAGAASSFSAVVLLGAWITIGGLLHWQWRETIAAELRQNRNTAQAFKEHTLRIIATADQSMLRMQEGVRDGWLDGSAIERITRETGMEHNILTQLSWVGPDGRLVSSNLDPDGSRSEHIDLSERDHVRVHLLPAAQVPHLQHMLTQGLFVSQPLEGKVSGIWTIQLSRKITAPDGRPLGVVVASLNQNYFMEVYRGVQLGHAGGVVLAGLDGVIRARVINQQRKDTDKLLPDPLVQQLRTQPEGGLVARSSDGLERIMGFSRVGDYPLVVLTGTAQYEALAAWRATRNIVLGLTLALSIAVVAFVIVFLGSVRRLAHSEALAQQASQAKTEFLTAMSHELRTPLTSIRGFAELLELRSKEERTREQAALIRQGAEHLNTLLTEILDLAKIEAGAMTAYLEPVELRPLLVEATHLFYASAAAKGLALVFDSGAVFPGTVLTDRVKLKQIVHNLLSNAIKFTREGSVTLQVGCSCGGQTWYLQVRDTGCGIAPELHEKVFEKFSQGSARVSYEHGGTGLGLALSRTLAQLLGGSLTLQSAPGVGTVVTLELPLRQG
ncbi:two-component sensor histidine kinase [Comamonas denitrificans]|uniref:histidine kinase n=1 Tax=Comamonas denitrificans TaxID=117506 RepID=A0A939KE12_9BURK|nr:ATP-binding protein [Comamonas denitrificans]MBO1248973.1 two-component sensor histidine kinase [Comamonas denitrificans]